MNLYTAKKYLKPGAKVKLKSSLFVYYQSSIFTVKEFYLRSPRYREPFVTLEESHFEWMLSEIELP